MTQATGVSMGLPPSKLIPLVLIGIAQAATLIALVLLFGGVVDALQSGAGPAGIPAMLALLLVAMAANAGLRGLQFAVAERIGYERVRSLRMAMYAHLSRMYPREVQHRSRGALLLRMTGDITMLRTWISRGVAPAIVGGVVTLGGVIGIGLLDPWMALGLLGSLLAGSAISLGLGMWLRQTTRRVRRRRSLLTSNLQEQLGALSTVQALGHVRGEHNRLSIQNDAMTSTILREVTIRALLRGIATMSAWLSILVVLALGAIEVTAGRASIGVVVAAAIAARFLSSTFRDVGLAHDYWQRASVSRQKITEFFASSASRPDEGLLKPLRLSAGRIELDQVVVAGSLHGVSAVAEGGEIVAIVGPTGSGKSALLQAVARLVRVESGRVLLDGQDVAASTARSLNSRIGLAMPDLPLMRGTVRRNLVYRDPGVSDEEVARVVLAWELEEILADLPGGLDGWVTEQGANLSAGQRQALTLARAFVGNPRVLVLDDPTAYLDPRGAAVFERIVTRHRGTVLIATHDPEVIRRADRIWHMDRGTLTEEIVSAAAPMTPAPATRAPATTAALVSHG